MRGLQWGFTLCVSGPRRSNDLLGGVPGRVTSHKLYGDQTISVGRRSSRLSDNAPGRRLRVFATETRGRLRSEREGRGRNGPGRQSEVEPSFGKGVRTPTPPRSSPARVVSLRTTPGGQDRDLRRDKTSGTRRTTTTGLGSTSPLPFQKTL